MHKNPGAIHELDLPFGRAYVGFPEASEERCTAVLALDVDAVELVRGPGGRRSAQFADQYVSDRPYAVSSFVSVAMRRAFGTAFTGRSAQRQELADSPLPLEVRLCPLAGCREDADVRALFEPLGYRVETASLGAGCIDLRLTIEARLADVLSHVYVLIPVLDERKHYFVGDAEVEKLLRHGEGWLESHPARETIARRYLPFGKLSETALERLASRDDDGKAVDEVAESPRPRLNDLRLTRVVEELVQSGASTVADLGCGSGALLVRLARERSFRKILGADASVRSLQTAAERLHFDRLAPAERSRFDLRQTGLTYRDPALGGYEAAALVEVIEHVDEARLPALVDNVFAFARPRTIVVTTPNAEYNALFEGMEAGEFRHDDHRFEWDRATFARWASETATTYGYGVTLDGIGEADPTAGSPTQIAVFALS